MSALDVLYGLVLDDGRRWGEVAVSWQRDDARAVLEPGDGEPRLHWLGRPKGGSKTTDLGGLSIAWLVDQAPALSDGYAVAADKDQANRLLDAARRFIARTPGLSEVLEVQAQRIVNRHSGARVHALEADVAGSEGLLSPWVVVDELPNWADTSTARRMWTSVISALPKWPGMRLVVIGHAGDPAHWSRKVLDVAVARGWHVREVPGPLPWVTDADLEMQRALLLPSEFERRHMNRWVTSEDRLTTAGDLRACVTLDGPQAPDAARWYVVTVDLGLVNDRAVVAVCSVPRVVEAKPKVRLDRMLVWQGSRESPVPLGDVETALLEVWRDYGASVVADPYQAALLLERLRARGVPASTFAFSQQANSRLAVRLFNMLRDHALELPDDAELLDELANVRLLERSPGVYRLDHDSDRHDDRAVTLALGCWALLDSGALTLVGDELADEWSETEAALAHRLDARIGPAF